MIALTDKEKESVYRYVGGNFNIEDMVRYIENKGYNPEYQTYFNNLLSKLIRLTPIQKDELIAEARKRVEAKTPVTPLKKTN